MSRRILAIATLLAATTGLIAVACSNSSTPTTSGTPGTDSGTQSGTDSGTQSGTDSGTQTGTDSGTQTGTDSGSQTTDSGNNETDSGNTDAGEVADGSDDAAG